MVRLVGLEHLEGLRDKPVVLFAPHFVGVDICGVRLAKELPNSASIYSRPKNPVLDRYLLRGRLRFGSPLLLSRQDGMRAIVKALRDGRALYFLPDMDFGARDAIFSPFFGVPAATVTALPRLAQLGRATVVPVVACQVAERLRDAHLPAVDGLPERRPRGGRAAHERVRRGSRPRDARAVLLGAQAVQDAPAGRAVAVSAKMTAMRLKFAKMQGQGNDFVVLDGVRQAIDLTAAQVRAIADRHFGVGCDQVLLVEPAREAGNDFRYRIWNADGGEVEQCGNGARCFARFVRDEGLTARASCASKPRSGVIRPRIEASGRVTRRHGAAALRAFRGSLRSRPPRQPTYALAVGGVQTSS